MKKTKDNKNKEIELEINNTVMICKECKPKQKKHNICIENGCNIRSTYNIESEKKSIYCTTHKKDGMINVNDKKCIEKGCIIRPTYNIEGEKKGLYCINHKKENMIDVLNSICKSEWCFTRSMEKYEYYCLFCYVNLFPDKPIARNYKTKEKNVVDNILKLFPNFTWIHDKKIQDGCSKRRPDLLLDMGSHVIIIEIDENAHSYYNSSCENKRLMEISQDLNHRPIIFIRFNPDDYIDNNGKNIKSCWKINKHTGIIELDKKKINEWEVRINLLKEQINFFINNPVKKTIEIKELFY